MRDMHRASLDRLTARLAALDIQIDWPPEEDAANDGPQLRLL